MSPPRAISPPQMAQSKNKLIPSQRNSIEGNAQVVANSLLDDLHELYILNDWRIVADNPGTKKQQMSLLMVSFVEKDSHTRRLFRLLNRGAVSIELDSWLIFLRTNLY